MTAGTGGGGGVGELGDDGGRGDEGGRGDDGVADGDIISTEVPALLAGVRADRGVAMAANVSRAAAAELIAGGRVLIDGTPVSVGRTLLAEGTTLTVRLRGAPDDRVAPEPGVLFEVVHADNLVAVVDKPAGLVVHPGAGHDVGTLVGGLLARFPTWPIWWPRVCARPTGPGSCTGSTRGRRGFSPWRGLLRRTGRSSSSSPRGRWSAAI